MICTYGKEGIVAIGAEYLDCELPRIPIAQPGRNGLQHFRRGHYNGRPERRARGKDV